jgi:hypothetical protein
MSNWERRAEASTRGQAEEESTGGEDRQCDLQDELDYCGCCLCSIWMFIRDVCYKKSNSDIKSGAFASSVWMKNEKFVTYDKLKCMNEERME